VTQKTSLRDSKSTTSAQRETTVIIGKSRIGLVSRNSAKSVRQSVRSASKNSAMRAFGSAVLSNVSRKLISPISRLRRVQFRGSCSFLKKGSTFAATLARMFAHRTGPARAIARKIGSSRPVLG